MRIQLMIHEAVEGADAIETWGRQRGHQLNYCRLYAGDQLPKDAKDFDFLVVMGGPQSPATTLQECPYFNAKGEIELIQKAISKNKFLLGVCLGAQLLGEAFGAKFEHSPHSEIGVFPIRLTEAATDDPIFFDFPKTFSVGHWHNDMPGLSQEAVILAASEGCPRQIVRYAPRAYGFQCHTEFTKTGIESMIYECKHDQVKATRFIQTAEVLREQDYGTMNQLLFKFLDRWTTQ